MNNGEQFFNTAAAGGYSISRSLRFSSTDSSFLSRTPASAGNRTTWTWAGWVKRSKLGTQQTLFVAGETYGAGSGDAYATGVAFGADDKLNTYWRSSYAPLSTTAAVFRDVAAWYHIVLQANATTLKLFVNGVELLSGSISGSGAVNSTQAQLIGAAGYNTYFAYADFMLADVYFIDGQALTPTSFGEFSATTGVWVPKAYTGTYGTNGFHLDFADNSAATAAALGKDTSGNGNNFTPNNLSVTAGAGNDSLIDVPVNGSEVDSGLGNQVRGNYATWNPITGSAVTSNFTITNGNLDASGSNANQNPLPSTIFASTGKWYYEFVRTSGSSARFGVINQAGVNEGLGGGSNGWAWLDDGRLYYQSSVTSYGTAISTGDVVMIALDLDAGKVWYGRNGTWFGSGNPATGANPSQTFTANQSMSPAVATGGACAFTANFGARSFAYTAPSGFKALCTANLPVVVTKPSTVFDVKLYTGNGGTQTISGLGFSPDFLWIKARSNSGYQHVLQDVVRGAGKSLFSSLTSQEIGNAGDFVGSFNSDGFSVTNNYNGGTAPETNGSGSTYAAWCWDAGSSTVTNTQGSISSQVRANPSAGFSVVSYTGNGTSNATVAHGLGVAPELILLKRRSGTAQDWGVYHVSGGTKLLQLNTTSSWWNGASSYWYGLPSSTVFYPDNNFGDHYQNVSTATYVAYCFAPVVGYSSFGSYTGNGSADGPFVYTNGMRPRFIMVKRTDAAGEGWYLWDTARQTYNVMDLTLSPNTSAAEGGGSARYFDLLSNGFKVRSTDGAFNASGGTYIYCAFAESPFAANNRAR
jgi:hypothetical protein